MPNDSADCIDALIDEALRNYGKRPAEGDPRTAAAAILERVCQSERRAIYQTIDSDESKTPTANRLNSRMKRQPGWPSP
jgi:hypothetical protein